VAFAIAAVTSLVVMYDAANVRREAGKHAELLNKIARDLYPDNHMNQEKLKELLGHKQIEVAVGAILGITIGIWL
jgi:acid phosphatase family membrane protein YuiD